MTHEQKIAFGSLVSDKVTEFEGRITAFCAFMNGCIQYGVTPSTLKDGVPQEAVWVDETQLSLLSAPGARFAQDEEDVSKKPTFGGPQQTPSPRTGPHA